MQTSYKVKSLDGFVHMLIMSGFAHEPGKSEGSLTVSLCFNAAEEMDALIAQLQTAREQQWPAQPAVKLQLDEHAVAVTSAYVKAPPSEGRVVGEA